MVPGTFEPGGKDELESLALHLPWGGLLALPYVSISAKEIEGTVLPLRGLHALMEFHSN